MTYSLTITVAARSATLRVAGDLDYETADDLVDVATQLLAQNNLTDLHVDFSEMAFLDSAALSGLLLVERRTAQADVELHLDNRPAFLDRVLQVTGLFSHFVSENETPADDSGLVGRASSGDRRSR